MYFIDTHAHLNDEQMALDLPEVIERAANAGIERIIVPGYDIDSSRAAVEMAERYEAVYATVGVHPHDSKSYDFEAARVLVELSSCEKVLAIGEIGRDFHYDFSPREDQLRAFKAQVELAGTLNLPIVVHSREANVECLEVLKNCMSNIVACVFHCFAGDEEFAGELMNMGFYIGVDGPVTYKSSAKLKRVVSMYPLDKILLETDCPYLSPIPYRGKRNEPAYLTYIAEVVASLKEMSLEELALATTANAQRLFGRGL